MHNISLSLNDEELSMLAELATATGKTLTEYLRASIAADWSALCDAASWDAEAIEAGDCECPDELGRWNGAAS